VEVTVKDTDAKPTRIIKEQCLYWF